MSKACLQCRTTKKKCDRSEYGKPCRLCFQKAIACSYTIPCGTRYRAKLSPRPSEAKDVVSSLPRTTLQELLELYFYYIHDRPHSLFHKPTLLQSFSNGSISNALLSLVCSFACRFHNDQAIRDLEPQLTAEAKRLFNFDIENVCLEAVQTALLIGSLAAAVESSTASEALYSGECLDGAFPCQWLNHNRNRQPDGHDSAAQCPESG